MKGWHLEETPSLIFFFRQKFFFIRSIMRAILHFHIRRYCRVGRRACDLMICTESVNKYTSMMICKYLQEVTITASNDYWLGLRNFNWRKLHNTVSKYINWKQLFYIYFQLKDAHAKVTDKNRKRLADMTLLVVRWHFSGGIDRRKSQLLQLFIVKTCLDVCSIIIM